MFLLLRSPRLSVHSLALTRRMSTGSRFPTPTDGLVVRLSRSLFPVPLLTGSDWPGRYDRRYQAMLFPSLSAS